MKGNYQVLLQQLGWCQSSGCLAGSPRTGLCACSGARAQRSEARQPDGVQRRGQGHFHVLFSRIVLYHKTCTDHWLRGVSSGCPPVRMPGFSGLAHQASKFSSAWSLGLIHCHRLRKWPRAEMAACRQYGTPTDIYSLGAVLRWLTPGSAEARVRAHSVWIHARSREHMTYLGQMLRAGPCPARRGRFARNWPGPSTHRCSRGDLGPDGPSKKCRRKARHRRDRCNVYAWFYCANEKIASHNLISSRCFQRALSSEGAGCSWDLGFCALFFGLWMLAPSLSTQINLRVLDPTPAPYPDPSENLESKAYTLTLIPPKP